jgi:hypothetical protein
MNSASFNINMICELCRGLFEAQNINMIILHRCSQSNYYLRKKLERKRITKIVTSIKIINVKNEASSKIF